MSVGNQFKNINPLFKEIQRSFKIKTPRISKLITNIKNRRRSFPSPRSIPRPQVPNIPKT